MYLETKGYVKQKQFERENSYCKMQNKKYVQWSLNEVNIRKVQVKMHLMHHFFRDLH